MTTPRARRRDAGARSARRSATRSFSQWIVALPPALTFAIRALSVAALAAMTVLGYVLRERALGQVVLVVGVVGLLVVLVRFPHADGRVPDRPPGVREGRVAARPYGVEPMPEDLLPGDERNDEERAG